MAKTGFIFLLLLVASFFEWATATNICTWGFYMCASNSQCISSRNKCDGTTQCTYGEDERNCPARCYGSNFRCSNNNCISRSYLCNGVNNCGDGSDESTALCGGTAFHVRLVGGRSSNEGRVEVYYSPTRTWGTVCDNLWDLNDAKVVCRQLGLPRATQAVSRARFGQGTGPILLDNVQCTGSELTLSRCSSGGWKNHGCSHSEDAGVVCGASLPLPTRRPTVNTGLTTCSWGNFYCSYGSRCVSSQWRCDGKSDCSNGEDERGCRTFCPDRTGNFRCNNYKCITRSFVCDGDNDCGDYSDESNYLCGSRRNTGALQCYSCSGSSGRCSSSITCSYLFGRGVCYKKTYDTGYGNSKRRVTDAGCRSSCTSSYRASACRNQRNCQMTCCSSSLCNRVSSGGTSSPYPKCHTCISGLSYKDCEKRSTLTRCSSTTSSCYKLDYKTSSSYGNLTLYSKGCIAGSSSCSQMRSTYCNSRATDTCNVYCCTGSGCNAGSAQRFSIVVLMTCAIAFFISQNVQFLP